jgi:hypothetical protein
VYPTVCNFLGSIVIPRVTAVGVIWPPWWVDGGLDDGGDGGVDDGDGGVDDGGLAALGGVQSSRTWYGRRPVIRDARLGAHHLNA